MILIYWDGVWTLCEIQQLLMKYVSKICIFHKQQPIDSTYAYNFQLVIASIIWIKMILIIISICSCLPVYWSISSVYYSNIFDCILGATNEFLINSRSDAYCICCISVDMVCEWRNIFRRDDQNISYLLIFDIINSLGT